MRRKLFEGKWWLIITLLLAVLFSWGHFHSVESSGPVFKEDDSGRKIIPLGSVTLRMPPHVHFSVRKNVSGDILQITTWRKFNQFFDPYPSMPTEHNSLVRVEIRLIGNVGPRDIQEYSKSGEWERKEDSGISGLVEYRRLVGDDSSWGALTYIDATSENITKENPVIFVCTRSLSGDRGPQICRTSWKLPNGPMVTYYQSGVLLPEWRYIRLDVEKFIDSIVAVK